MRALTESEERRKKLGGLSWYLQCREHKSPPAEYKPYCFSCEMVAQHNAELYKEIAAENGWLIEEPAGDVPMAALLARSQALQKAGSRKATQ